MCFCMCVYMPRVGLRNQLIQSSSGEIKKLSQGQTAKL